MNFIDFKVIDEEEKPIQLMTYRYPAVGKPKAVVIMFHGLNAHIGNGAHLAHKFA